MSQPRHVVLCRAVPQGDISVLPWTELEGLHRETSLIQVRRDCGHAMGSADKQHRWAAAAAGLCLGPTHGAPFDGMAGLSCLETVLHTD